MKKKVYKGYMCGTAFHIEMLHTDIEVYPSVKLLKNSTRCWKECGIIQIEITEKRTVFKGSGL